MTPVRARNAAIVALLAALICSVGGFEYYRGKLAANVGWDSQVVIEDETRLGASIFKIAEKRGLIGSRNGPSGELFLNGPACEGLILNDAELKRATGRASASSEEVSNYRTALRLLCNSPQGEEIRNEIEAWNAVYDLLAVRDNRFQDDRCQSKRDDLKADVFVPRDCKPNSWKAERVFADSRVAASWIPGAEPPPADFNRIADDKSAYSGDWAMLKSADSDDGTKPKYRLHSEKIELSPNKEVMIDLVGRLRGVRVYGVGQSEALVGNARTHVVDPAKPETPEAGIAIGPARVAIFILCGEESAFEANARKERARQHAAAKAGPQRKGGGARPSANIDEYDDDNNPGADEECDAEPPAASRIPISYQIVLLGPTGRNAHAQELIVEFDAESVQILPAGLRKNYFKNDPTFRLTRHIKASCSPDFRARSAGCELTWERVPGSRRSLPPPQFNIVAAENRDVSLVDKKSGIITSEAFDEGFGSIVGLGPQDWGSLIFSLAHRPTDRSLAEPVELTIDRRVQTAAREAVEAGVKGNCTGSVKKQRGRKSKVNCRVLRDNQTATLVVLDADKHPGEIKAVTTWPRLPKHLNLWDLEALEVDGMGMAGGAWRLVAPDQRPGSTFKVVTAMAAMDAATNPSMPEKGFRDKLLPLLRGRLSAADQKSFLRLTSARWSPGAKAGTKKCFIEGTGTLNAIAVPNDQNPVWCARNYNGGGYSATRSSVTCARADAGTPMFGMCEALMSSSNLFFAGVGEQITRNGPHAMDDSLALETMARRLSFDDQPCLDSSGKEIIRSGETELCGFDLLRRMPGVRAQKLVANPIQLDLKSYDDAARNRQQLLRTGWGDGGDATPVAMASVFASLGYGKLVRPSLRRIPRRDGCPTSPEKDECDLLLPDWNRAKPLFESLRMGLHAVSGPGGTASSAFNGADALRLTPGGKPRLFVKTGSATYRAVNEDNDKAATYFSLWLTGWIDGVEGTPISDRLAFACVVTRGVGNDTGGGVCAPLVRQFLENLNRSNQKR